MDAYRNTVHLKEKKKSFKIKLLVARWKNRKYKRPGNEET